MKILIGFRDGETPAEKCDNIHMRLLAVSATVTLIRDATELQLCGIAIFGIRAANIVFTLPNAFWDYASSISVHSAHQSSEKTH